MASLDAQLMTFRTTWMRAVAKAWNEEVFFKELISEKPGAAIALLQQAFPGFKWPWPGIIDFSARPAPTFVWVGDDWSFPDSLLLEDELIIHLPLHPRHAGISTSEERVQALADYYAQRPSIFGTVGSGSTPRGSSLLTSANTDMASGPGMSIHNFMLSAAPVTFGQKTMPAGGYIPNSGTFLDFEVVLMSALAKAWDNRAFSNLLDSNQPTARVLSVIQGYQPPWRLLLKVKDDTTAKWTGSGGWTGFTPHHIILNLPAAPEPAGRAIALAAYNSLGAEFPFTCCA